MIKRGARVAIKWAALLPILFVASGAVNGHTPTINYEVKPIALPDSTGAILFDHIAYDRTTECLWVPASNTGNVDVIDQASDGVRKIPGFKTAEVDLEGRKMRMGPTAACIGEGWVYIANRGDSTLSAINRQTLERGETLPVARNSSDTGYEPHAAVYVATTREVWIPTGPGKSIEVFDASAPQHLKWKLRIPMPAATEGSAVDNQRGKFYTNIEATGKTIAIDVLSHKISAQMDPGSHDLQGLALDTARGFLFVACGDHVVSFDIVHGGKLLDSMTTGAGLDDIDFSVDQKVLYAAGSFTATLTIADVNDDGKFYVKALIPTAKHARSVIAAKGDTAYLIDPAEGRILKVRSKS
jgi:DNA-binding beta-propeller fold protein YncE